MFVNFMNWVVLTNIVRQIFALACFYKNKYVVVLFLHVVLCYQYDCITGGTINVFVKSCLRCTSLLVLFNYFIFFQSTCCLLLELFYNCCYTNIHVRTILFADICERRC